MKEKIQDWIQSLQEKTVPIAWVPGACFYSEAIELPEGIQPQDVESFLSLELEDKAPFPVDNLYFGYVLDSTTAPRHAFLYASYSERARQSATDDIGTAFYALPAFFPFLPWPHETAQAHFVLNAGNLSLMAFDATVSVPQHIWSLALKEDATQGDLMEAQKQLTALCDTRRYPIDPELLELDNFHVQEDDSLACFRVGDKASAPWRTKTTTQLWQGDLRDVFFQREEIQKRSTDRKLWWGLLSGSGLAVVLLLVTLVMGGTQMWLTRKESFLREQSKRVAQIEDNDNLLRRLDQFSAQELRPFKMLDVLNEGRPDTLYFVSARAEDLIELSLEGNARSVDEVNIYKERLEGHEDLAQVNLESITSTGGAVRFSMRARFREGFERT